VASFTPSTQLSPAVHSGACAGPDVVLVGYQDQGNLGMGYLAAALEQRGRKVEMIDIRDGPESVAARLLPRPPLVVGFSLIFQYFLPQYRRVAAALRQAGIASHFTIGGHYASLCPEEPWRISRKLTASFATKARKR